ncbi:MAG: hypothetical protein A2504_11430 [Bdellovibrionales bacterium RIFOXYD12_FULL_39_22]|nr:MAG: hypothetical protein A2385_15945 [Bdellovibrionales bacterium RIFOXYB1_FULL_39_21]OFZ44550.1 MAG: hypothetical protein A2485_06950 [Bdellovibrionales bacterium RIFOXYC12_FULL_39_17]OFZ95740.1 MAG: hypothetical protein A2504_11430 [Bdellovibrionales bacterium RIFOXYD12_FULL_39_22]
MYIPIMNNKFEKFLKINMWISNYLLFALPVVIGTVIGALSVPGGKQIEKNLVFNINKIGIILVGCHFSSSFFLIRFHHI